MKIYRSVCTYVWNDDKFPYASDDCQLVWFHIFTNPVSSPLGLFRASIPGLAEDKNRNGAWPLARYRKGFEEALKLGFLKVDPKALLISFPKYFSLDYECNHPVSPNQLKNWGERFNDLPESPLKDECYSSLKALLDAKRHGIPDGIRDGMRDAFALAFSKPSAMPRAIPDPDSLSLMTDPDKYNGVNDRNYREEAKVILAFLNEKTHKKFREVDVNLGFIEARLKSGVDVQTCKTLICRKIHDWAQKPDMQTYLRPETLFNKTKFESYLASLSTSTMEDSSVPLPKSFKKIPTDHNAHQDMPEEVRAILTKASRGKGMA